MIVTIQVKRVSSKTELYNIAQLDNAVRCGATINPEKRKYGYSTQNSITMHFLEVKNMYSEENQLLSLKKWRDNIQQRSNVGSKKGNVYVITEN